MEKIYCISGLGADASVFQNLAIDNAELIHVPWAEHDEFDTMESYAHKILPIIKDMEPILMGLSFGGMLSIEIAKLIPVKKTILISSAKTAAELTKFGRFMHTLVTSQVVPAFVYKLPNSYLFNLFGVETEEEKNVLRQVLKNSDGQFMRWAMKAVEQWENTSYKPPVVHIHGTADKIIAPTNIKADYWIQGGGHFMIHNRAKEISTIINKELQ